MSIGRLVGTIALATALHGSTNITQAQEPVQAGVNKALRQLNPMTGEDMSPRNCKNKPIVFLSDYVRESTTREEQKGMEGNIIEEYSCIMDRVKNLDNPTSERLREEFLKLEGIIEVAKSYGIDTSIWQKEIDKIFTPEIQRPWNQVLMKIHSKRLQEYPSISETERSMAFISIYQDFEMTTYYRDKLKELGADKKEVDKSLHEIIIKFIPRFLDDLIEIIGYDKLGKYPLKSFYPFGGPNPYSRWKEQFEFILDKVSQIDDTLYMKYKDKYILLIPYVDAKEVETNENNKADDDRLRKFIEKFREESKK